MRRVLRRLQRVALVLGVLTGLGFASGWLPGGPVSAPAAVAIHEGNEPTTDGGGLWLGSE